MSENVSPIETFDVVVIGAGVGGFTAAALFQKDGYKTLLLEAHDKAGGCAGYFFHRGYNFDAGATVLMGLDPSGLHTQVYDALGVVPPESTLVECVRVHLPDRTVDIFHDQSLWERERVEKFASGPDEARQLEKFWKRVDRTADILWRMTEKLPALPLRGPRDLFLNLRLITPELVFLPPIGFSTVESILKRFKLAEHRPFRAFLDGLLLITTQETAENAPFANAAAGLDIYRHGIRRARGGMKYFVKSHIEAFRALGGRFQRKRKVTAIEPLPDGTFQVLTDDGVVVRAEKVVANLPVWNIPGLFRGQKVTERPLKRAGVGWGAFTCYIGVQDAVIPPDSPLNHQVLMDYDARFHDCNSCFLSLSESGDRLSAPEGCRTLNVSTHTNVADWEHLSLEEFAAKREELTRRILTAVEKVFPNIRNGMEFVLPGTPRTFERYTHRARGMVGGIKTGLWNSNLFANGPDDFGLKNFRVVGDTVFPGQGTMACALSAINVWRDLTGARSLGQKAGKRRFESQMPVEGASVPQP